MYSTRGGPSLIKYTIYRIIQHPNHSFSNMNSIYFEEYVMRQRHLGAHYYQCGLLTYDVIEAIMCVKVIDGRNKEFVKQVYYITNLISTMLNHMLW